MSELTPPKRRILIDGLQADECDVEVFQEWNRGGLSCVHTTCMNYTFDNTRDALSALSRWRRAFRHHPDLIEQARTADDITRIAESGRTAVILGFQNTLPLEDDLALVEIFYDLGIRCLQMSYNHQGLAGSGCLEPNDSGLSLYGKKIISEMNRLGMIVDVSHCGLRTTLDSIEHSSQPIAVTHSNPSSFGTKYGHKFELTHRLKSDDVLKKVAETGGMFGMVLFPAMLPGGIDCKLETFVDMVEHAASVVGHKSLGLGTDFVWRRPLSYIRQVRTGRSTYDWAPVVPPVWPEWMRTPADLPRLADELARRKWTEEQIDDFLGQNWLDYYRRILG
ncbi:membrane dipeptidase [Rhodobacter sp. 24-YEA-8]|uniref:membrane dipeptidase n=1 Tax=Rhodobacter sp. 24-YEA-8 TaxID=1884310 RepID=UPI0008991CFB|nr:membrane dipeptidase [Rhodobacter sp. 24-YEA-8]SED75722.1 Zn-dependent dipeptidase, dipeptidase homolog [Rhodobacter sp. 24-YEA-8]